MAHVASLETTYIQVAETALANPAFELPSGPFAALVNSRVRVASSPGRGPRLRASGPAARDGIDDSLADRRFAPPVIGL